MNSASLSSVLLRLRLAVAAAGPVACGALMVCLAAALALVWLAPQRAQQQRAHQEAMRMAVTAAVAPKSAPVTANENLVLFYDTLGEQRYAEQQVGTLFGLAGKAGLTLSQGEYKRGYDQNARMHTYQVNLPVKGSYRAVWQFGLLSLRAIPYASLDELSFKRETIGDAGVEARLRLTLYLAGPAPGAAR